MKIANANIF